MKYIVMSLLEVEHIFIFPRTVDHDRMFEACEAIRFGGDRNWERKYRRDGECVGAGFVDGGRCHGRSESLNIDSRGEKDTALLAGFVATVSKPSSKCEISNHTDGAIDPHFCRTHNLQFYGDKCPKGF